MPRVSVVMPVFNGAMYLMEAVDSILQQDFSDFEFLVIDDASTDSTPAMLASTCDRRLRVLRNPHNLGVAESLNRGLAEARGAYIARMDADDWSDPRRLSRQVAAMDRRPSLGVLGGWIKFAGRYSGVAERRPTGPECVRAFMMLDNPVFHPSVLLRRSIFLKHGLKYDFAFGQSEDFDLWERASRLMEIDNISTVVLTYRIHGGSVTDSRWNEMDEQSCQILSRGLQRIGINPTPPELRFHRDVCHGVRLKSRSDLEWAGRWMESILAANTRVGLFDDIDMRKAVDFVWFRLCLHSSQLGLPAWRSRHRFRCAASGRPLVSENRRFLLGMIWHTVTCCRYA